MELLDQSIKCLSSFQTGSILTGHQVGSDIVDGGLDVSIVMHTAGIVDSIFRSHQSILSTLELGRHSLVISLDR